MYIPRPSSYLLVRNLEVHLISPHSEAKCTQFPKRSACIAIHEFCRHCFHVKASYKSIKLSTQFWQFLATRNPHLFRFRHAILSTYLFQNGCSIEDLGHIFLFMKKQRSLQGWVLSSAWILRVGTSGIACGWCHVSRVGRRVFNSWDLGVFDAYYDRHRVAMN